MQFYHNRNCGMLVTMNTNTQVVIAIRVDNETLKRLRQRAGAANFRSVAAYIRSLIANDMGASK